MRPGRGRMTIDKARELSLVQAGFGDFYNADSTKLIRAEVAREHGQAAADALIRGLNLDSILALNQAPVLRVVWPSGTAHNPPRKTNLNNDRTDIFVSQHHFSN